MTIYDEIILCWINDFLLDFLGFLAKSLIKTLTKYNINRNGAAKRWKERLKHAQEGKLRNIQVANNFPMQRKQQFSRVEREMLIQPEESDSESEEELEKQLLKSRLSRAMKRRQIESDENNISIAQYLDRITGKTRQQLRDRSNQRITQNGGNKQELNSSTGRNSPDESDEKGPANKSNSIVAMDSDEETSSVTLSLSKVAREAIWQLQDKSNSKSSEDGRNKQTLDSSFVLWEISIAMRRDSTR